MLYPIKNTDILEILNKLVSLNNPVADLRLREKLGNQNFHEKTKSYLNQLLIQLKIIVKF